MKSIRSLLKHLNDDVMQSGLNLVWRVVSGPITLILLPLFTTPGVQGYWYTFISLGALSVLADLGFTTIATQFVAHEFAFLTLDRDGLIRGEEMHLASTAALLRFVARWGVLSGAALFPFLFGIGIALYAQKAAPTVWLLPWTLFSIGTLINYWGMILASFLQGAGQVARVQRISLYARVVQSALTFGLLIGHGSLYALALSTLVGGLALVVILAGSYRRCLRQLLVIKSERRWGGEVFSLLWRYATSWLGGYLNLQVFTPIAFQLRGPVLAGRVGITVSIWLAATSLSIVWLNANVPKINVLVERSRETEVRRFTNELLRLAVLTFVGCVAVVAAVLVFGELFEMSLLQRIVVRFMGLRSVLFLIAIGFANIIVTAMVTYVRAHKEEPFLVAFLVQGILTVVLSLLAMRFLDTESAFAGFLVSTAVTMPWIYRIFQRRRREWGASRGLNEGLTTGLTPAPLRGSLHEPPRPKGHAAEEDRRNEKHAKQVSRSACEDPGKDAVDL